ncbi:anthranilate phosphoribosyltransferase [Beijerinckia indica]|uniref:Anthranilate phosphoribosyltransferase n=1 Tax=Beijerinckia indica subsp. indica (strain ATCC 9039 / DSM 1715 / NCIMB 8712) TaxID=395963 RepID=TRPD_BEII9|nr:anthranilate phosphoribosyltransferase [Beijerinckia indica]B2IKP4.1 RecName: Full=Anthranilate phosphoribosyltransferase [Beijerinckia indica subsp. indica ATCC 9039]ACB95083.1 anthranilate phosphoribosyltransferase [Beijerinckia indica subsp. indica ATCC 9039]
MDQFKPFIAKLATGSSLTRAEAEAAFDQIFAGEVTPAQLGGFLMAMRVRGETVDEIIGAVTAMRARMVRVDAPTDAIDIVGTGGDGHGTFNVSTLASLIVAACGVPVAKHGNRAASSRSGASDVLSALGVRTGLDSAGVEACIRGAGIGFMMAQTHHTAMRHVASARVELGTRTIFNLLGPLCNPAGVTRQLLGVFSQAWLEPLAQVLQALGGKHVWVVHGSDGLDELTTTGPSFVTALEDGAIRSFTITPEMAGLPQATLADLKGGDPETNAAALREALGGKKSAYRDIALLNAAAALVIAAKAKDLKEGVLIGAKAVDSGAASAVLAKLVALSNQDNRAA